jgi:hypothetical protein
MRKIKSVNVLSVAMTAAIVYGCISLVVVPFILLLISIGSFAAMNQSNNPFGAIGAMSGIVLVVIIPLFYAVVGFIFGAIGAFIYNLSAKWTGGIALELEPQTGV